MAWRWRRLLSKHCRYERQVMNNNLPPIRQKDFASNNFEDNVVLPPRRRPAPRKKESKSDTVKSIVYAILLALIIRTFLFEPFNIPSGSMIPNLLVGDYLFVSKYSYGYSAKSVGYGLVDFPGRAMETKPKRGDVIVFKLPKDPSIDYIKRLIGLPGDRIQVKEGRLYINGEMLPRDAMDDYMSTGQNAAQYIETLPPGNTPGNIKHRIIEEGDDKNLDNTKEFLVPAGHYFFMGDNRDNSSDSRDPNGGVGFVPEENLVGRAEVIFFSLDPAGSIFEVWTWPKVIRWDRLLKHVR